MYARDKLGRPPGADLINQKQMADIFFVWDKVGSPHLLHIVDIFFVLASWYDFRVDCEIKNN